MCIIGIDILAIRVTSTLSPQPGDLRNHSGGNQAEVSEIAPHPHLGKILNFFQKSQLVGAGGWERLMPPKT